MLSRIQETDLSVPFREGGYFYYSRTEEGQQYPIFCRRPGTLDAPEQVTLDVNGLARGHRFMAVGAFVVSDDGRVKVEAEGPEGAVRALLHRLKEEPSTARRPGRVSGVTERWADASGRFAGFRDF